MKYIIIFCLLSICSCQSDLNDREDYMDISVVRDVTDPHLLQPDANAILNLYNLPENKNAGVNFRYCEISDRVLIPVVDLHLPDGITTNKQNRKNTAMFRERTILNFYSSVRKTLSIADTNNDSSLKDHSECFKTIASQLSILAGSKSSNRILLVYSNLFENSAIMNIYARVTNELLVQNPNKIAAEFEKTQLLPENLKDIKVFLVFQPATREEDFEYLKMAGVYKQLLEARGASIKIQANNNY